MPRPSTSVSDANSLSGWKKIVIAVGSPHDSQTTFVKVSGRGVVVIQRIPTARWNTDKYLVKSSLKSPSKVCDTPAEAMREAEKKMKSIDRKFNQ